MNPISDTAYYCTGVRMLDANKPNPTCNDIYAERFMNEHGLAILDQFKDDTLPNTNNAVRHRIIDDLVTDEIRKNSNLSVFIIGAGFDSRAYRIAGGNWIEVDEPQIIEVKNEKLPIKECHNPLQRLAIDFSTETILDKLDSHATKDPCIVIIEGVFMYLDEEVIKQLLISLQKLFPKHKIFCDLMTRKFFNRYGKKLHHKFKDMNAEFSYTKNNPEKLFVNQNYTYKQKLPIVKKSLELEAIPPISNFILNTFLKTLRDGYAIYEFQYNQ